MELAFIPVAMEIFREVWKWIGKSVNENSIKIE